MGGNYNGLCDFAQSKSICFRFLKFIFFSKAVGNTRRRCAEFNFFVDTEAAFIVLENMPCPITILPWEACSMENLRISMDWRFDVLGSIKHDFIDFMNPIEDKIFRQRGFINWAICDALLIACILHPEQVIRRSVPHHCTVELQGTHTRGQVVIDHFLKENPANVNMIELIEADACMKLFLWAFDKEHIEF